MKKEKCKININKEEEKNANETENRQQLKSDRSENVAMERIGIMPICECNLRIHDVTHNSVTSNG